MNKEVKEIMKVRLKMVVLEYARLCGNASKACKEFKVSPTSFYAWKKAFEKEGKAGLYRKKPIANNHPKKLSQETVDKILELRKTYQMGSWRVKWYLECYHGIAV